MSYPLYIVMGTSGSGKSTTAPVLRQALGVGYNVYDMDSIVVGQDFQSACRNWVRIAYYNALSGNVTVLFGAVPYPYNVQICDFYGHFNPVRCLLLHCDHNARTVRLQTRGGWTDAGIRDTNAYAAQLHAYALAVSIPVIHTGTNSVSDVASRLHRWITGGAGSD